MSIETFNLGVLATNCYVVSSGKTALVVDPGGPPAQVIRYLKDRGLALEAIVNTHLHCDHIEGNAALAKATGAPILASGKDRFLLDTELGRGGFMGLPMVPEFSFDELEPGERTFAGLACTVLATPGHSPGSLTLHFPAIKAAFSGDCIFARSVGRTDFPGGDMGVLAHSITEVIFGLPDDTSLYSGHGQATSVAQEKLHNPFFGSMAL